MESKLQYINPGELSFSLNDSDLIMAKYKDEDMGRVAVLRMFPFEYEEEYLCVRCENYSRSDKETEIGIIRRLSDFSDEQIKIVRTELEKRYFVPSIIRVNEVKEEFGHTMWKTVTTAGEREFTVTDMSSNVINLGKGRIMLVDVYGNRYYIPDISKADDKTTQIIEIWI